MIDELVKTIRLHLSERLTSPLMGAFICSWILWNYRAVLIIVSEEPVARKFTLLATWAFPDLGTKVVLGVVCPLATALFYIFIYPIPARFVYDWTSKQRSRLLEIRRRNEGERVLTIEDTVKFKEEFAKKQDELLDRLSRRERENDVLVAQNVRLNSHIQELESSVERHPDMKPDTVENRDDIERLGQSDRQSEPRASLPPGFSDDEGELFLQAIQDLRGRATVSNVARRLEIDSVEVEVAIDALAEAGFLEHETTEEVGNWVTIYSLTMKAKRLLVELRRRNRG